MATMTRTIAATGLTIAMMALVGGNAGAADKQKVWEGFLQITSRTNACTGVPGTTGNHVSVYRPKLVANNTSTFLSIIYTRAAISLLNLSEDAVAQMNGAGNYKATVIGNKAKVFSYNSTYNFTVTPGVVAGNNQIVTISNGLINDIFNVAGCNITFDAKYHRRN